ncbi:RDD family protein [Streptomyces meridianus]|uniref:RDD family protein n=1 Tax=Streptomyces meridianus TaxID=2938945 RepID=A0ABT0X0Y5_9ACTN|nr:RDD family protein [Streptomyces meridianus]MCM2575810.1 RDD family protein [Streptomyces meridianus]
MSAPTSGSDDASPGAGYYPDPSIPGYIRYWNGASWVPGTSRPAPRDGEDMPSPPAGSAPAVASPAEQTGPMFFDEDPVPEQQSVRDDDGAALPEVRRRGEVGVRQEPIDWDDPQRLHGGRPESAAAWNVDAGLQSGFGGEAERRVSWGLPPASDDAAGRRDDEPEQGAPEAGSQPGGTVEHGGTMAIRMPPADRSGSGAGNVPAARQGSAGDDGTMAIRAQRPPAEGGEAAGPSGSGSGYGYPQSGSPAPADGTMAIRLPGAKQSAGAAPQGGPAGQQGPPAQQPGIPQQQQQPGGPAPHQQPQGAPGHQQGYGYPQAAPPSAPAAGQPAWTRQGHLPASGAGPAPGAPPEGVVPWRPPVSDPFLRAAQEQASARPAALGRRLAARLVDTVLLGAVVGAVAVPLGTQAVDHIGNRIEAAKQSGRTVTVWLLDGTTTPLLGIVLGVFLLAGLLLEVLPTVKWGSSPGKRLCGVRVLAIEVNESPTFGAALRRWLVYGVLGLLGVGLVNVLWCLVDRPWRQCWHDKAARTFVAGN